MAKPWEKYEMSQTTDEAQPMSPWLRYAAESEQEAPIASQPIGLLENIGMGLSSAVGGLAALPYSGYVTATEGREAGEQAYKGVREAMTYEPMTDAAKWQMQKLGELFQPAVEAVTPYAKKWVEGVEESTKGALAPLGETVSETGGYLMGKMPQTAMDILGIYGAKGLAKAPSRQVELIDAAGRPTKQLQVILEKQGLTFEALTPEARQMIPRTMDESLLLPSSQRAALGAEAMEAEVLAGGTQAGTAPYTVLGRDVVPDAPAQFALKQGWEENLVAAVKQSTPKTREQMLKMLDMKKREKADLTALKEGGRASDVAGDALMDRYKFIREQMNTARNNLDDIAKNELAGQPVSLQGAFDVLNKHLRDLDVEVVGTTSTGKPMLNFKNSLIAQDRSAQRIIRQVVDLMEQGKPTVGGTGVDALRLHNLKRQIDTLIDYTAKSGKGLTESGQRFAKDMRGILNRQLRELNEGYAKANDTLSEGINLIERFQKSAGAKVDMTAPDADKLVGQQLRRLFSNVQSRVDMDTTIRQMDDMVKRLGGKFDTDVYDLAQFANALDRRFGATAQTGFQGSIEAAGKNVLRDVPLTKTQMAIAGVEKAAERIRGINEPNAFRAMEELLRRGNK